MGEAGAGRDRQEHLDGAAVSGDRETLAAAPVKPRDTVRWWRHVAAGLAVVWSLAPVAGLLAAALSGNAAAGGWPCRQCASDNLSGLFSDPARPYLSWFLNSLLSAAAAAGLVVLLGVTAAYGISRLQYRGRRIAWDGLLLLLASPAVLAVVGIYLTVDNVGEAIPQVGRNTWLGLALAYVGATLAWVVWLITRQLQTFPGEVEDAAVLDGAGHARIFVLRLRHLGAWLAILFGLVFGGVYGEFMLASVLLSEPDHSTLAVGLSELALGPAQLQGQFAAGALLASLPAVLVASASYRGANGPALLGPVR